MCWCSEEGCQGQLQNGSRENTFRASPSGPKLEGDEENVADTQERAFLEERIGSANVLKPKTFEQ